MRVLRIIARLNVGGPAQHVVWLTEGLAKEGFETLLVTGTVPEGEEDMSGFAAAHGVTPLIIPSMSRELSWRDVSTIFRLWRLMVRFRPDIVHTHTAKAGAVGRLAGLLYPRAKFIHTFHGHIFHSYFGRWKTRLFLAIERMLARLNTDRLIVLSEQQLREIRDEFRIGRAGQFAVVPLGIDLDGLTKDRLKPVPTEGERLVPGVGTGFSLSDPSLRTGVAAGFSRPAKAGRYTVGIVGRLTPIKNHDLFLRVAERLKNTAQFVIYGDGAERERLERLAGEHVVFAGTRPISEIYPSLDVVALTSRNEGTPLALIEAMASGVAVISTAVGGVVDLLGAVEEQCHGYQVRERGVTVASDDTDGFVAGLSRLLRDEPLRRRVITRGETYVRNTHSKESLLAGIMRVYCEIG